MKKEKYAVLERLFGTVRDFDGFFDFCEELRILGATAILTDEEGSRPFVAERIFTCEGCGVVVSDGDWNCVAFTEHSVISIRPLTNDYFVYSFGITTASAIYPPIDDEYRDRSYSVVSFYVPAEKCTCSHDDDCGCGHDHSGHDHDNTPCRSDDESYLICDIGLNHLFTSVYDLTTLGDFCDAAMAVLETTSDEDEAMALLSINSRVQDPMAHCFNVAKLAYDGGLNLIAEDDDGEELRLLLTEDKVAGVERIACVNNSFYCAQIDLAPAPGERSGNYLQLAIFL